MLDVQEEARGGGEEGDAHSEELILPGSVSEMNDFEQHASTTACYSVSCCVPEIRVHLPSKRFLETLYNRSVHALLEALGDIQLLTDYLLIVTTSRVSSWEVGIFPLPPKKNNNIYYMGIWGGGGGTKSQLLIVYNTNYCIGEMM